METYLFHLMPYQEIESEAWPYPQDTWDPEKGAQYYHDYIEQLTYADELGIDGLGFNEHHYTAYGLQPSPNIMGATLAAKTEQAKLAFFGNLPAIRENPIRLAEELAMLDNISEGRVVSGFPRGIPKEYLAYNIDLDNSRARFEEAWDLILKTWTADEPFDFNGEFYQYENVYAWPRPYQQPHPELWYPAESDKSIRFAAEREVPIGTVPIHEGDEIGSTFSRYREFATEEGWTPEDRHFTYLTTAYVADSVEQARQEVEEAIRFNQKRLFLGDHLGTVARMMGDEMYDPNKRDVYEENLHPHGKDALEWTWEDQLDKPGFLVGPPELIVEKLERLYEQSGGFGRIVVHLSVGNMDQETSLRNIERYMDEVKPEVDRIGDVNP